MHCVSEMHHEDAMHCVSTDFKNMYYGFAAKWTSFFLEIIEITRINFEVVKLRVIGFFS